MPEVSASPGAVGPHRFPTGAPFHSPREPLFPSLGLDSSVRLSTLFHSAMFVRFLNTSRVSFGRAAKSF